MVSVAWFEALCFSQILFLIEFQCPFMHSQLAEVNTIMNIIYYYLLQRPYVWIKYRGRGAGAWLVWLTDYNSSTVAADSWTPLLCFHLATPLSSPLCRQYFVRRDYVLHIFSSDSLLRFQLVVFTSRQNCNYCIQLTSRIRWINVCLHTICC